MACVNAAGYAIPPLVIFARKTFNQLLAVNEIPGTMYGLSDTGWMNSEIFCNWFTHHFLVHTPASRPLLLLLDGHSTHYNPEFVRVAAHEQVIVFCLPPNTTHLTQPLDKGVFGPLKSHWNEECQRYMSRNPRKVVTHNTVFSRAWYKAMTIPNIISAFRTTGVFPLNRTAIDTCDDSTIPLDSGSESLAEKTGLAFIPFYTPIRSHSRKTATDITNEYSDEDFTEEERQIYIRRLEEGYDITTDLRYNFWLKKYTCSSVTTNESASADTPSNLLLGEVQSKSVVQRFLPKLPQSSGSHSYEKKTARVLTSAENRKQMEEKERKKQEMLDEKERRK